MAHLGELPIVLLVARVQLLGWDRLVILRDVVFREHQLREAQLPVLEDRLRFLF